MKIVVIDDDELDFRMIKRTFQRAFEEEDLEFAWIYNPRAAKVCPVVETADLCFVDYRMEDEDGVSLIRKLTDAGILTPLVLLTGEYSEELDQLAIAAGASDFLHKDRLSVSSVTRLTRHCLARRQQEERLAEMAYTDPLTGLKNRAAFARRCDMLLQEDGGSTASQVALLLFDLDDFKIINDTLGHPTGDEVLKQFSASLKTLCDGAEIVARLGGDEFVVLMRLTDPDTTVDSLRRRVRAHCNTDFDLGDHQIKIKCSIGAVIIDPQDPRLSTSDLLKRCDQSLYSDKRLRKILGRSFDEQDDLDGLDLLEVVAELEAAIAGGQFELVYQPKVNFRTGQVSGMEALIRWPHPKLPLGPKEFIPLAEEFGLAPGIGRWALRAVCKQIAGWQARGIEVPRIAINISPKHLEEEDFTGLVRDTLAEFDVPPEAIEFELTEGAFGRRFDVCRQQMIETSKLGCRWAIDDFGIGYSSLSRLHKLPISRLKIDKFFLSQIPSDPAALKISNAIISMARGLGMGVVAEGVEAEVQLKGLELVAEDELQGYYYYRPLPLSSVERLLSRTFPEPQKRIA